MALNQNRYKNVYLQKKGMIDMATKNIKERTKKNYIRMWDYRIRNTLGNIRVVDFKTSHVRTSV